MSEKKAAREPSKAKVAASETHPQPLMYVVRLVVHICGVDRGYHTVADQYSKLMQYPVVPRKSDRFTR